MQEVAMSFDLPGIKLGSDLESLFKAIGFIVIQWGIRRTIASSIVGNLFYCFDGNPLLKGRPRNLEPKVKFLSKMLFGTTCACAIPRRE
jgi:hypothetical protein